jgi:SAM-dependent methyltransferase
VSNTLRKLVRDAADAVGMLPTAFAAYRFAREWRPTLQVRNWRLRRAAERAGPPIPPGALVFSVAGSWDVEWFLRGGRIAADSVREALADAGRPIASLDAVLDFGCGCGRVLRHLGEDGPRRLVGCDYNPAGPAWVNEHLPFAEAHANALAPPLPYADASFDAVFALSVFTHLPQAMQEPWFREMHRVLRPGGLLLFSARGERWVHRLLPDELARLRAEGIVTRESEHAGTNMCAVWHTPIFVERRLADHFTLHRFAPDGAPGNAQDLYTLRRVG